jgi:hypothetical protein
MLCENFKYGHSVNASRLHSHAAYALLNQQLPHLMQICGKTSATSDRLRVAVGADGHPMLAAAHIDPGRIRVDDFQCLPVNFLLNRLLLFANRPLPAHDYSYFQPMLASNLMEELPVGTQQRREASVYAVPLELN